MEKMGVETNRADITLVIVHFKAFEDPANFLYTILGILQ